MKRFFLVPALLAAVGLGIAIAQPPAGAGGRPPLIEALDADGDGTISADELKNATAALSALDKNQDGALSPEEYRPRRARGPDEPGSSAPSRDGGAPSRDNGAPRGERSQANRPERPDSSSNSDAPPGTLLFSGGFETNPVDHGRPVVLIAGALGVSADVFREAFSHVRPARAGTAPEPEQVRKNKAALMNALGKFGVTNDRLNTVSNYYRYEPHKGELWPTTPASGHARIENGKITGFVITSGGSGYSSPPSIRVQGMPGVAAQAKLAFGPDFQANGTISEIELAEHLAE